MNLSCNLLILYITLMDLCILKNACIPGINATWCLLSWCAAAAAAKSLQSCLTLCDPTDGSPPGSLIPGVLQARTLEWVAISFSNAWKWKVKVTQSCPTLSDPMDWSPPGSSIHGIFQARVLEWGANAFSTLSLYLLHLVGLSLGPSLLLQMILLHFLWLGSIPLHKYTTSVVIHLSMDIYVVCMAWLMWIVLLWT